MKKRLFWVLLTPLLLINIILGIIIFIPYWIITGNNYYNTIYFEYIIDKIINTFPIK